MQNAVSHRSIWAAKPRFSLSDIARELNVPVVVANFQDDDDVRTHATYGLDFDINWSEFAAAIDALCVDGAKIIPNIAVHDQLSYWSRNLAVRDIRFFAGIPLRDADGFRIGSISVIANQKDVARAGIPIRRLGELGREFVGA
jgi:hypothetical protein